MLLLRVPRWSHCCRSSCKVMWLRMPGENLWIIFRTEVIFIGSSRCRDPSTSWMKTSCVSATAMLWHTLVRKRGFGFNTFQSHSSHMLSQLFNLYQFCSTVYKVALNLIFKGKTHKSCSTNYCVLVRNFNVFSSSFYMVEGGRSVHQMAKVYFRYFL